VSSDTVLLKIDRFGELFQRRSGVQRPVRPVLIVMGLVLAQDPPQMVLVPDEGAVEKLAPASPDPVGLDYWIWHSLAWQSSGLRSSLGDLLGRLLARALSARLPDGDGPA
jgi:hypothetical protein